MIPIPLDFDGNAFANKFCLGFGDFSVINGQLYCPSLPNLTELDIADCVVDQARFDRIQSRKDGAKAAAGLETIFKTMNPQQAVDYIENNVNDLLDAKGALKIVVRLVVALINDRWPENAEE